MTGIDRELLRDLDRHLRGPQQDAPPAPEVHLTPTTHVDISSVLDAIQLAASSMNAMAKRVEQLEAHSQAFEAANHELEDQSRQLAQELGEAIQKRNATAANLEAEKERIERLEALAAQHVSWAKALEHELAAAQSDLTKVVESIRSSLGAPSFRT